MKRFIVLASACVFMAGCASVGETLDALNPFSKPASKQKPAPLPPLQPSVDMARLWQASLATSGEYVFTPAVVGDTVYAAARDGTLARFTAGRQVWRIAAGKVLSAGVGADEKRVVVATPKGELLAFHAEDGRLAWQAPVGAEILAAPALAGDLLVVRSSDSRIFAFDAREGRRLWTYQRSTPALAVRSAAGVVIGEKAVYVGFPGGKLVALAQGNGGPLWEATVALPRGTTELERIADVASEPVIADGQICAAAFQGRVACFDLDTGRQQWAREVSSLAGLAIGPRAVFVSDDKGVVHAFDRTNGASLWRQDKLARRQLTRPLVLGSRLAIADFEGILHLLSATDGALLARHASDGSAIRAAPQALPGPGALVVQTKNGALLALSVR